MNEQDTPGKGRLVVHILLTHIGRLLLLLLVALVGVCVILYCMMNMACHGPSQAVKETFATTILETGALKWTAKLLMTDEEINEILANNSVKAMDLELDSNLIKVAAFSEKENDEPGEEKEEFDINGITIEHISGRTFEATMLIVNDPSRISLQTNAPDFGYSKLNTLVEKADALGGVNAGVYDQVNNKPYYLAVSHGETVVGDIGYDGLFVIGFDEDDILQIIPAGKETSYILTDLVREYRLRDATCFIESFDPTVSHFVQLVINGIPRETNGSGSGCNPRTAIGQRADGSVLLLVTDGRGANGHLGATAQDLVEIMLDYGAVNAANIDGGGSSAMYFDGEYLMTSTTLCLPNQSYMLPHAFVIERRD